MFWGKSELLHKMQLSFHTWKGSRKDSGCRSCWQYSKISVLWMASILANWENAWLQRREAGSASRSTAPSLNTQSTHQQQENPQTGIAFASK